METVQNKSELLDWECADANTQYLTHGIHRYSGKFIPQIASNAINLLTHENDLVLDVYAGSGTTLLEAALNKRKSIGVDLNPLAVLISKVKTTPIDQGRLEEWSRSFSITIQQINSRGPTQHMLFDAAVNFEDKLAAVENDERLSDAWYTKWFPIGALTELIWIDINIREIQDKKIHLLAMLALSDVLRKSSNAHSGYPNVMFDKNKRPVGAVIPKYLSRLNEIIECVSKLDGRIAGEHIPQIIEGNNTSLPMADDSVDAIITHPPYIGSVPYAEYGLLSIKWLGRCPKSLDAELTGGQRQRKTVVERFICDYEKMFQEAYRVLKGNKHMFILVGNPTVRGEKVDLSVISEECARKTGFILDAQITRKGVNRRANLMGDENILIFKKG